MQTSILKPFICKKRASFPFFICKLLLLVFILFSPKALYTQTSNIPLDTQGNLKTNYPINLTFKAYKNNIFQFTVNFLVKPTTYKKQDVMSIYTKVNSQKIQEENICFLSPTTNELLYVFQTTKNGENKDNFKWEVDNTSVPANAYFYNLNNNKSINNTFTFQENAYTVQAWLYVLLHNRLNINSKFNFKLLVPTSSFWDMFCYVKNEETIIQNATTYQCYKIEIGLAGLLGVITPKTYFWVTKNFPHKIIKFKDSSYDYH
jgi:hypothetical protein